MDMLHAEQMWNGRWAQGNSLTAPRSQQSYGADVLAVPSLSDRFQSGGLGAAGTDFPLDTFLFVSRER